jgi:hypothetical protein
MPVATSGPVAERIASEIEYRLKRLLSGSSTMVQVSEVIRPKRMESATPKNGQIIFSQSDPEIDVDKSLPGNPPATAWRHMFHIRGHFIPSELDPTPIDVYQNYFVADVRRVICEDASWWTFDGLAIYSEWGSVGSYDLDGTFAAFDVPLIVTYRTDEDDPYQLRT